MSSRQMTSDDQNQSGLPKSADTTDLRATIGFVWYFLANYPGRSALMVLLLAGAGLAEGIGVLSILPVIEVAGSGGAPESTVGQVITGLVENTGLPATLPVLLGLIVVAMTIKAVFRWFAMRSVGNTTADVTADLRLKLLDALLNVQWQTFAEKSIGELANSLGTEAHRASGAFRQAASVLGNVFIIAVYVVASFLLSWKATTFALVAGVLFLLVFKRMVVLSRSSGRRQTRLMKFLTGRFVDALSGLKAIKAMGLEEKMFPLLRTTTQEFAEAQKEHVFASQTQTTFKEPVITLILAAGIMSLVGLGEPISQVLVLAFIAYRILGIIGNVQSTFQGVVVGESAFWSLQEMLESLKRDAESKDGERSPPALDNGIRFDSVGFSYGGGEGPVLSDLDLFVPSRTFVALTGESGSGKTTIADLILGLYRPDAGEIYLDDVPMSQVSLAQWRDRIGYVPQEAILLHDTIRTNLTFGDPDLTEEDITHALKRADAYEFVMDKSAGLETVVGEHGAKLSGGQRQRIAIARSLLRDPEILVLDEPTTALDPDTEAQICNTLTTLSDDLTILAISHQSAIRKVASLVLHLEEGSVTVHSENIAQPGGGRVATDS